uniref:Transmembrane protein 39B n=1 Tax=Romanomermis culicivorax TaxID=13658 RepID=A0A915JQ67_ROMCU
MYSTNFYNNNCFGKFIAIMNFGCGLSRCSNFHLIVKIVRMLMQKKSVNFHEEKRRTGNKGDLVDHAMPSVSRKSITKAVNPSLTKHEDQTKRSSFTTYDETDASTIRLPCHAIFPELPAAQGELFFECTLFLYSVLAMFLQYLNLYKTMWWLPHSHKFHLIDLYLLSCIGLILGRRVTVCFLKKISLMPPGCDSKHTPVYITVLEWSIKLPAVVAILSSFSFSFLQNVKMTNIKEQEHYLYVDIWWSLEVCLIVSATSWTIYTSYLFPLQYCDLLHRCAQHLGAWEKLERQPSHLIQLPIPTWSENYVWNEGSVVKQGRSIYKGQGLIVAAEPSNPDHFRFYMLLKDPMLIVNGMCGIQACLIFCQFLMLVHSTEWQHIITLALLMFANYLLLFKLFKDKIIMGRIYHPNFEEVGSSKKGCVRETPAAHFKINGSIDKKNDDHANKKQSSYAAVSLNFNLKGKASALAIHGQ